MRIPASEVNASPSPERGLFDATQWSLVLRARDNSEQALNTLCAKYRLPMITWLRTRGCSPHDAEDLVHGLFTSLLSRRFLDGVEREKGRFRSFLLRSLKNHWLDHQAKAGALRRGGGAAVASLNEVDDNGDPVHQPEENNAAPDAAFDRAWAAELLNHSLLQLQKECASQGHARLLSELEPVLFRDETSGGYRAIGERLAMSEGSLRTAAARLRARLRGIIREEILQTISHPDEWESEVRHLMELFSH